MRGDLSISAAKTSLIILAIIIASIATLTVTTSCRQADSKMYVIGFIDPNPGEKEGSQGFLRNMPKHGYIEGKNVKYIKCESRDSKIIDAALKDMVAKKVDLIFTMTTPVTKKAVKHTEGKNIPVLFVVYEAVDSGVVRSLVRPGGNLTGIQLTGSTPKTLEWLMTINPGAKHVLVPVTFDTGAARRGLDELKQSAAKAGLKVTAAEVRNVEELSASLSSMPEDVDALFMLHSFLTGSNLNIISEAAKKRKIPIISAGHVDYEDGLVMSYAPTDDRIGAQAARLAHNILQGTSPANLPVETSEFYLGINLQAANSIGMKIPYDVLQQAEFIIR